ncbi:MAG: hypothetical protein K2R98_28890 [Gemmataceae bacterium]|nr:hypothetical protein [Gemmataceae bacterium]
MIGFERWIDPRVRQVKVADVQKYLLSHGWVRQPYPKPELLVFAGPKDDYGKPIIQSLPAAENYLDYQQRLIELITAIAVIEDRMAPAVLDDILREPRGAVAS